MAVLKGLWPLRTIPWSINRRVTKSPALRTDRIKYLQIDHLQIDYLNPRLPLGEVVQDLLTSTDPAQQEACARFMQVTRIPPG